MLKCRATMTTNDATIVVTIVDVMYTFLAHFLRLSTKVYVIIIGEILRIVNVHRNTWLIFVNFLIRTCWVMVQKEEKGNRNASAYHALLSNKRERTKKKVCRWSIKKMHTGNTNHFSNFCLPSNTNTNYASRKMARYGRCERFRWNRMRSSAYTTTSKSAKCWKQWRNRTSSSMIKINLWTLLNDFLTLSNEIVYHILDFNNADLWRTNMFEW